MPKSFLQDIVALEDLLERFASAGYTLGEVEELFDTAMEEVGYYDEYDEDDEDEY